MRATIARFDNWFTKGLEGVRDLVHERSGREVARDQGLIEAIKRFRDTLKKCLGSPTVDEQELPDIIITQSLDCLNALLTHRNNQGNVQTNCIPRLEATIKIMDQALERFNFNGK